jgi:UDP-N-acetylmuramoyl-tripeptide--D-alanyl-D-alanine ligase
MATPIPQNRAAVTLAEILAATGGEIVASGGLGEGDEVEGVSTDTRAITAGALFVALRGETFDGHDHVARAAEAGARAVVIERDVASPR